jgi:hypothetical protein
MPGHRRCQNPGLVALPQVVYAVRECQRLRHMAVICAAVPEPPKPASVTAPLRSSLGDLFPTNDFFDPVMTGAPQGRYPRVCYPTTALKPGHIASGTPPLRKRAPIVGAPLPGPHRHQSGGLISALDPFAPALNPVSSIRNLTGARSVFVSGMFFSGTPHLSGTLQLWNSPERSGPKSRR